MKSFFCGLIALILSGSITAQSTVSTTSVNKLPAAASYEGDLVAANTWNDANGKNYLILTRTPDKEKKDKLGNDALNASLYAYYYAGTSDTDLQLLRKVQDFVNDCPLDLLVQHLPESLTFTDLDGDKKTEITFVYRLACRGDVSGPDQKLMLLEGKDKYAIRGVCGILVPVGENGDRMEEIEQSTYTVGEEFNKVPKFLEHAKTVWETYKYESF